MTSPTLRRAQHRWPMLLLLAALIGTILAFALPRSVLDADVRIYMDRMDAVVGGELPYTEAPYEHYPLALVPMLIARLIGGDGYGTGHVSVFALQMFLAVLATGLVVKRVAVLCQDELAVNRWMWLTVAPVAVGPVSD